MAAPLADHARSHRVRVILARRPGDMRRGGDRHVFLAHTGAERRWIEQLDVPAAHPERLLDLDLGPLAFPDPPGLGDPGPAGLALVCTNGRHDPCCADLARPVVRALVAAGVPDVWESSHVGGDRFAANVVSLPDGVYYGRVEPDDAPALLAAHRAGTIDLAHYRGRSHLPPLVQAADLYAAPASGRDAGRRDDRPVDRAGPRRDHRGRAAAAGRRGGRGGRRAGAGRRGRAAHVPRARAEPTLELPAGRGAGGLITVGGHLGQALVQPGPQLVGRVDLRRPAPPGDDDPRGRHPREAGQADDLPGDAHRLRTLVLPHGGDVHGSSSQIRRWQGRRTKA